MFENIIRDDFTCTKACYTHNYDNNALDPRPQCTHTYDHISQQLDSLADTEQQNKVYTSEEDASLHVFIDNGATPTHKGGGTIESHFWIELPLKLENQVI